MAATINQTCKMVVAFKKEEFLSRRQARRTDGRDMVSPTGAHPLVNRPGNGVICQSSRCKYIRVRMNISGGRTRVLSKRSSLCSSWKCSTKKLCQLAFKLTGRSECSCPLKDEAAAKPQPGKLSCCNNKMSDTATACLQR